MAFEFNTKKISIVGIDYEILDEVHKLPYPVQKIVVDKVLAIEKRLEKGKEPPGLVSLDCQCLFFHRYLLPCKHIFHDHIYGTNKLLTANAWVRFQQMFEDSGFEIYVHRELVEVEKPERTETEKAAKNR